MSTDFIVLKYAVLFFCSVVSYLRILFLTNCHILLSLLFIFLLLAHIRSYITVSSMPWAHGDPNYHCTIFALVTMHVCLRHTTLGYVAHFHTNVEARFVMFM